MTSWRRHIDRNRRRFLAAGAMTIAAAHLGLLSAVKGIGAAAGELAAIGNAAEWLNSPRLTPAGLAGKVVLVDFWTYTCINWLRTLPYIRALGVEKYKEHGLVVIGVHTPEFGIREESRQRPPGRRSTCGSSIRSRSTTTTRSGARSATTTGRPSTSSIRAAAFASTISAKGEYERSEKIDSAAADGRRRRRSARWPGVGRRWRRSRVAADWDNLRSPENYLGYARTANFASPGRRQARSASGLYRTDRLASQSVGARRRVDDGKRGGGAQRGQRPNRLPLSRPRPASRHGTATAGHGSCDSACSLDGQPPGAAHGGDVDEHGQRHGRRAAAVSTDPANRTDPRSTVRDRVPRSRRAGVRVHVRLIAVNWFYV